MTSDGYLVEKTDIEPVGPANYSQSFTSAMSQLDQWKEEQANRAVSTVTDQADDANTSQAAVNTLDVVAGYNPALQHNSMITTPADLQSPPRGQKRALSLTASSSRDLQQALVENLDTLT